MFHTEIDADEADATDGVCVYRIRVRIVEDAQGRRAIIDDGAGGDADSRPVPRHATAAGVLRSELRRCGWRRLGERDCARCGARGAVEWGPIVTARTPGGAAHIYGRCRRCGGEAAQEEAGGDWYRTAWRAARRGRNPGPLLPTPAVLPPARA